MPVKLTQQQLIVLGVAAVGVLWLLTRGVAKAATATVQTGGKVLTGEIVPPESPYRNSDGDPIGGVAASAGAGVDAISGGIFSRLGGAIGGGLNDIVNRVRGTGSYQEGIAR